MTKSQSVWSAIGNSLKTALLTAIKDVVTSRVAAMLMGMFYGTPVSFAVGRGLAGGQPVFGGAGLPAFAEGGITSGPSIVGEAGPELVIPLNKLRNFDLGTSPSLMVGHYGPETDAALQKLAGAGIGLGLTSGLAAWAAQRASPSLKDSCRCFWEALPPPRQTAATTCCSA